MIHNFTIDHQLNHRSIRAFKPQALSQEQLTTLYEAARHTSTSNFWQAFSILHVTDEKKRAAIRQLGNQPYIGKNGDLLIFMVDLFRNQRIRQDNGKDDGRLHTADVFQQAVEDTVLAVQNTLVAAESMGLGGVILGSIKNDPVELIKILELPKMVFPLLGLQVGIPDQEPQLKPRLPLDKLVFENDYNRDFHASDLKDYDAEVTQYYDLRDANRRIDSFTHQICGPKLDRQESSRDKLPIALHQQGLALDWNGEK
ncbi:NADPH-dependent oxidoreductase [Limosilactobacillus kribbianus]|uniref:NADPH-dependent oxidoreductase n=1 Tax=Limosilactobacillus kribbianus TaxID=2982695 RepID=UPI0022646843|nr:NADPH-dependent oxidoreductase [Limosilactobacillus kribbianus]